MTQRICFACLAFVFGLQLVGCGGGVPIKIRIDEFSMDLELDDALTRMEEELAAQGILPFGLPAVWPDSLPDIQYDLVLATDPVAAELTKEGEGADPDKYEDIEKVIRRIEINRFVLRVEQSNLTLPLPKLALQVADEPDADPNNRRAWFTVGYLPGAPSRFVGDMEFEWVPGGESFLNSQLAEEEKAFAIRTIGTLPIDTELEPVLPRGAAKMRLIVVATFFVEPENLL